MFAPANQAHFTLSLPGLNGLIHHAAIGESSKRLTRYRLELVPQLHYLALRRNQRIFQHLSVPQIIARLLEDHGIQGDPDQPLVSGCLYNSAHPVPYALPEHTTRSLFKTQSSPAGISLNGPGIKLNAGGSPSKGSGAAPKLPGEVVAAEQQAVGKPLLAAQKQALMRAAPCCEICQQSEQPELASDGAGQ